MADTVTTGGVNKMVAMIAGAVLLLVGILGFVMSAPLLGIFDVNMLHNIIHLLSGVVLLAVAFINNGANARMTLLVLGVVYAIVTILGFVAPGLTESLIADNVTTTSLMPDNILHALLAIVFIAVPLLVKEDTVRPVTGRPNL
jgi:hypothetical protein